MPHFPIMNINLIDPDSEDYILPNAKTPAELVRLLYARQIAVFGETISQRQPELTARILQRNFKLLLKKYDIKLILRGIERGIQISDYPFSTAFVEEMILRYLYFKE